MGFVYIKHPLHCCLAWWHLLPVFGIQQPQSLGILSRAFGGGPSFRPPTPQAHPSRRRSRLPLTWRPQLSSPEHSTRLTLRPHSLIPRKQALLPSLSLFLCRTCLSALFTPIFHRWNTDRSKAKRYPSETCPRFPST